MALFARPGVLTVAIAVLALSFLAAAQTTYPGYPRAELAWLQEFGDPSGASGGATVKGQAAGRASYYQPSILGNANYVAGVYTGAGVKLGHRSQFELDGEALSDTMFVAKVSRNGDWTWVTQELPVDSADGPTRVASVAGAYEGVAAVGAFQGSLSVDGISGLSAPAAGNSAGFAVYLNADGRPVWSRAFVCGTNDAGDAAVEGVVMSTDLAITVVGTFTCTNLTVGPVTLERQHPSATASVFAARFGSDGTYHWAKVVNSAVAVGPKGADIAIDSDGNVYAAAIAKGLVVDGTGQQVSAASDGANIFVSSYMFDGTLKDAFKARTAAAGADDGFDLDGGLVVSQDGNGNMAAGFSIDGRTDFGSVSVSPSGPGQRTAAVVYWSDEYHVQWASEVDEQTVGGLMVDDSGRVVVASHSESSITVAMLDALDGGLVFSNTSQVQHASVGAVSLLLSGRQVTVVASGQGGTVGGTALASSSNDRLLIWAQDAVFRPSNAWTPPDGDGEGEPGFALSWIVLAISVVGAAGCTLLCYLRQRDSGSMAYRSLTTTRTGRGGDDLTFATDSSDDVEVSV